MRYQATVCEQAARNSASTRTKNTIILLLWFSGVCAIIIGSLLPGTTVSHLQLPFFYLNDKFLHFSGYLLVAALPAFTLKRRRLALACALGLIPLGVCLEFLQRLIPGRSFELGDMAANAGGVLTGLAAAYCWRVFCGRTLAL